MVTAIIIIIIILLIIIATSGKQKKTANTNMSQNSYSSDRKEPSSNGLNLAYKFFGNEWQGWLDSQTSAFNLPKNFYGTIGLALDNLSSEEQKNLLLSFLKVGTTGDRGNALVSISVEMYNYGLLHLYTFTLIKAGNFSENSMTNALKQIASSRDPERSERQKKDDDSIIDVTGKSYQIPEQKTDEAEVPYWQHQYVYSYSELNYANFKQKQFYSYYKS